MYILQYIENKSNCKIAQLIILTLIGEKKGSKKYLRCYVTENICKSGEIFKADSCLNTLKRLFTVLIKKSIHCFITYPFFFVKKYIPGVSSFTSISKMAYPIWTDILQKIPNLIVLMSRQFFGFYSISYC